MRLMFRALGGVLGVALIVVGFFFWMYSNDGVASETSLKTLAGASFAVGLIFLGAALASTGSTSPGDED